MANPLQSLGFNFLKNTAQQGVGGVEASKLTRRGFLLGAAALSSCSRVTPEPIEEGGSITGPIPRNPTIRFTDDFKIGNSVTYTRAMVSGKYIAMTFDDGPHPQNTPRLLRMLRARNIKATFYVIGQSVNSHPSILRQTVDEGHEIGNHTQTHRLLTKLGDDQLRWEMKSCRDAIQQAAGYDPKTMRPPYGALNQRQRGLVYNEFGYPTILWSVDPMDWKRPGPSVVASRILSNTTQGGIVLAHDLHAGTVSAMPSALDGLLRRGFKFVTVSQLLAMQSELSSNSETTTEAQS